MGGPWWSIVLLLQATVAFGASGSREAQRPAPEPGLAQAGDLDCEGQASALLLNTKGISCSLDLL